MAAGFTVSVAVRVTPPAAAVIVTAVCAVTALVAVVNVAVVAPAATMTLAGTVAAAFELVRVTTSPPVGAPLDRVTVPADEAPPTRLAGARATPVRLAGGLTVRVVVRLTPPKVAVSVTAVADATDVVVAENVALVAPAATLTLAGTVTAGLLLARATVAPPVGRRPSG